MERSIRRKVVNKLPVIMAFLIPVLILLVLYIGRGIFPFGENTYLRSDMYHQYAPFMREFQRNLQQGGSLLYAWNIGLGNNFASTYAYYLASPVNWLSVFFPDTLVPEFMNLMLILKSGAMSSVFAWYLIRKFKRNDYIATCFGCFYAMSSYMAAFSWNVMWLDCLVLFPLILVGLEALIKEGRHRMYVITLTVCVISNYYISIMICIFLVLYALYLLICEMRQRDMYTVVKRILTFAFYSILSGCMALFIILPALFNLLITASADSAFPSSLSAYYNILEMFAKAVINTEPAVFSGHFPNIYATMALFLLVPLYWISKRVPVREKAGKTILVLILALSFMFNVPTFIWHGFHFPNSLPCRYSFIYIFLVLSMAYQALIQIRRFQTREIVISAAAGVAGIFLLQLVVTDEGFTVNNACLGAFFVGLYLLLSLQLRRRKRRKGAVMVFLMLVTIAEIVINTNNTGYSTTSRVSYVSDNEAIAAVLQEIPDDPFYRVEKVTRRTKNDGTWSDYPSASIFSSTTVSGNSDFYDHMGLQGRVNAYSYYGHTPVTQALLGVKYELADAPQTDPLQTEIANEDEIYLYENKYAMALGFMVDRQILDTEVYLQDPFGFQNDLLRNGCGVEGVFHILENIMGDIARFDVPRDGRCLLYITSDIDSCTVEITRGEEIVAQKTVNSLETPQIVDAGDVQAGDEITILSTDSEENRVSVYPAVMDYGKYEEAMQKLMENELQIDSFADTRVTGHITAPEGQLLFTTIPYDEGWRVLVDGEETEYSGFKDSFIILDPGAGTHEIELLYMPRGLAAGAWISGIALCVFVASEIFLSRRRKKCCNSETNAVE